MFFKREAQKPTASSKATLHQEALLQAMKAASHGDCSPLKEEDCGSKELAEAWNTMMNSWKKERQETTLQVNHLLNQVTRMDSVRDMVESVTKQTDSLHTMLANSEELGASIQEVANSSTDVSSKTNETSDQVIESVKQMNQSMEFVVQSFEEIERIDKDIQGVKVQTEDIGQIIDIVKGIAEQTNLLALNAAIEAARAGEQGRGFAVVAEEVRKLAEHTSESVVKVQQNISELQKHIDTTSKSMSETASRLNAGKDMVEKATESVSSISESIDVINDHTMQVAANMEEQSAATETLNESMSQISEASDFLARVSQETGGAIFGASKKLNDIRMALLKHSDCLDNQQMIEVYKTDHLLWRWRVYNMLLGLENVDDSMVANYQECRLGKWYYSVEDEMLKKHSAFANLESPHIQLHQMAKKASDAYKAGNMTEADRALEEMDRYSKEVFRCLDEISAALTNTDK
ncbi:MAG: chemotaxis protein [Tindallia sp. MSAO_Bac2]|nr:MAG: chemotaxis protein [Tindallia sp. MSAO_Bac2]